MGQNIDLLFIGMYADDAAAHFNANKPDFVPALSKIDTSGTEGPRVFCSVIWAVSLSFIPEDVVSQCDKLDDCAVLIRTDGDHKPVLWADYLDRQPATV
jgi:hypothetical protein